MRLRTIGLLLILTLSILAAPLAVDGQQTEKVRRIGFLSAPTLPAPGIDGFRQGLQEHGYVEGRNLLVEWQFAEGRDDRLPGFAAELVRLKVEVIVTVATSAALAAKKATPAIPIVFTLVADPVASGLVPSLARPGGNLTGVTNLAAELTGKRLELLKEAVPLLKSVVILTHPANPVNALILKKAQIAAHGLGLDVRLVEVRQPGDLEPAFTTIAHERASGVVLVPGPFLNTHRIQIAELAIKGRLPVLGWANEQAQNGALISYGARIHDIFRRAAAHVAKILKGARPADLPVEQPMNFELVVNLKTAKALGLTIPQSVLLRADRIIQ